MGELTSVTDSTFEGEVLASVLPVLVDFWAAWCNPCTQVEPVLRAIAEDYHDSLRVVRLNVDENTSTAMRYTVMGLPTLLLFVNGKPWTERLLGQVTEEEVITYLQSAGVGEPNHA